METKITLGIYGGTFDPPHNGHIRLCEQFSHLIGAKTLVIPAKTSPLKVGKLFTSSDDERIEMCNIAFGNIPNVEISKVEIEKDEVSFTYKTIKHFLDKNPDEKIAVCLGTDCLETLECWANAEYIIKNCVIVAAQRYNDANNSFGEAMTKLRLKYDAKIIPLSYSPLEISSSEIREACKEKNYNFLKNNLPCNVLEYIFENKLYEGV